MRALRALLYPGLGTIRIFMDESIETGADWPHSLAQAHSRSKVLVPILSRDYFGSDWCRLELALMYTREELSGLRTASDPRGVIVPITIDDGDSFPVEVRKMQLVSLHEFANPFMRTNSPRQEALAEALKRRVCPAVEHALHRAPTFNPEWEQTAHGEFDDMFKIKTPIQRSVPPLVLPPIR